MEISQAAVNSTHAKHRQELMRDLHGEAFVSCQCGKFYDTEAEANAHWWRALRATQRVIARHASES